MPGLLVAVVLAVTVLEPKRQQHSVSTTTVVACVYSEPSLIRHLFNPTFSLIRPLYEVQSPYINMVRGTP